MSIMFANTRSGHGTTPGHLLEFKAGRTLLEPGSVPEKRKAVADKSRGLVFIKQSSDQLMHFCWKNRDKNTVDLDLIIFPGDTEFIHIKECNDGRVFMLKFKSCEDHKLFWMQDGKAEKDDDICKKVNELLNNPPSSRASARGGASERSGSNALAAFTSAVANSAEDIGALGNMDQSQIMQLFSLMNGGSNDLLPQLAMNQNRSSPPVSSETPKTRKDAVPAGSGNNATSSRFDNNMINQIISNLPSVSKRTQVDLSKVLTRSNVENVVASNADALIPHLPSTSDEAELSRTVGSPQFQQAADFFSYALQSGQMGQVLHHFDVPDNAIKAANNGDLLHFSKELTKGLKGNSEADVQINKDAQEAEEETADTASKKAKDGQNDDMDLD